MFVFEFQHVVKSISRCVVSITLDLRDVVSITLDQVHGGEGKRHRDEKIYFTTHPLCHVSTQHREY